jgi:hypothetical protein
LLPEMQACSGAFNMKLSHEYRLNDVRYITSHVSHCLIRPQALPVPFNKLNKLFRQMFLLRLQQPHQLIERLQFQSTSEADDDSDEQSFEERERVSRWESLGNHLMAHLARYLRGVGHTAPSTEPNPKDPITPEMREAEACNVLYRAERFLALATGCEIQPVEPNWLIEVRAPSLTPAQY